MISTVLAISAIALGSTQEPTPSAKISAMLMKYNSARTLSGRIVFTQGTEQESGRLVTKLQYERPAKLYIYQQLETASGGKWLVTSNGKHFSYNKPDTDLSAGGRLVEAVDGKYGLLTISEIYAAATRSLGDRSAPLDIAISRKEDLQYLRFQWQTVNGMGSKEVNGEKVFVISGKWRMNAEVESSGTYELWINDQNDLRGYMIKERLVVAGAETALLSRWDVNLTVNQIADQSLFQLIL